MAFTPVFGHECSFGLAASAPTTKAVEVQSFGLVGSIGSVRNQGMRGTRTHNKYGIRTGLKTSQGPIVLEPRVDELAVLLPFILGGTAIGTSYPLAEVLPSHVWDVDSVSDVYRFTGVYVNRATFRSSAGQPMSLTLECIGSDWTNDAITFPSISGTYSVLAPFMHYDLVLTVDAVAHKPDDFTLVIDNRLSQIFRNSQTPSFIKPADRIITLGMTFGNSTDEQTLWALTAITDAALVATFSQATTSLAFTLPTAQTMQETPRVNGRPTEVTRSFQFQARATAALGELTTVLDSTP